MKIQVIHGPNLNMLGIREPETYGTMTLENINSFIQNQAQQYHMQVEFYQSNSEGALIDEIHRCYKQKDAIIINPGAYTHYSYALRDAIAAVDLPTIEVHLSDIHSREDFRKISVIKDVCELQLCGKGVNSYLEALSYLHTLKIK